VTQINKPKFMTCSVHLSDAPWCVMKNDPPGLHQQYEAIEKMHRFCHEIYNVPITWLASYAALMKYKEYLVRFVRDYGDEVAIMDGVISSNESLGGEAEKYQSWVEACGLSRPGSEYRSKEAEVAAGSRVLHDLSYDDQMTALSYLKQRYDEILGQNTRALAVPWINGDTIKVMKELGMDVSWGYCWNYFCEGINHKGSLLQPFYISDINHTIPSQQVDGKDVLAIPWGTFSPVIAYGVEAHSRMGAPGYCLNALELANRSEGHDKFRYHENIVKETLAQGKWNRYAYVPLQLEAAWMDEAPMPEERYTQFPSFNSANTEVFYTEIETALRSDARPLTLSGFADWFKEKIKDTPPTVYYSEDYLPDLRSKGKDQAYPPMVIYADKTRQYWFSKARGMNYLRKYEYASQIPENEIVEEYPFEMEPRVFLKVKTGLNLQTGIKLSPEGACYEAAGMQFSAYDGDPNYAAILWKANIPAYIQDSDLETGGAVTGFRTIRDKNAAIVFANLRKGTNDLVFRSDLPSKHVRIKSVARTGQRYEIWLENDGDEVVLHTLNAILEPGLKIGGFWWDGLYSRTIFRYGWGVYDWETGAFELKCFYPVALKVNHGLTRVSVELLYSPPPDPIHDIKIPDALAKLRLPVQCQSEPRTKRAQGTKHVSRITHHVHV
jgi:hypothetical protein